MLKKTDIYKICQLYKKGYTTRKIGKVFNKHFNTIKYVLKKNNIIMRPSHPLPKLNNKQDKNICELYKNGRALIKIAKKYDCSIGPIIRALNINKILRRNGSKKELILPKYIMDRIDGELLGDASINKSKKWGNACLAWMLGNLLYVKFLIRVFSPHFYINYEKRWVWIEYNGKRKKYRAYQVWSERNPTFTKLHSKWYPNGIKIVPSDIILTPKTCLHWYIGDGSLHKEKSNITLHTDGFSEKEVNFLILRLKKNIGINATKFRRGNNKSGIMKWAIYIPKDKAKKFLNHIGYHQEKIYPNKWNWKSDKNNIGCLQT